ncbi:MAG: hypothetical protein MJB57_11595, partial [Gemmatimonadetes bacterium]|nr:hypothetical protein [Gemmatimonadota bacterium]
MPLTVVRSDSNAALWRACASRFLDELESATDPIAHPTHLWIAHRTQRDLLLAAAEERGLAGWLAPPVSFLSELPERFGIERRPLGPLTTRLLLARIAGAVAREQGFDEGGVPGRSHVIDRLLSELLPEGVAPERLAAALEAVAESDFASARNEWTAEVVRRYATEVESTGRVDPRALPAMIATRVEEGGLPEALGGATRLHVYGVATLRGRSRLYRALAAQSTVDVRVYLASDVADGEWESLADAVEDVRAGRTRPVVDVQPAPDAV